MERSVPDGIEWDNIQHPWVEVVWWEFQFQFTLAQNSKRDAGKTTPTSAQVDAIKKQLDLLVHQWGCLMWLGAIGVALCGVLLWTLVR
ncbi:hypothetical protein MYMAC_000426 [Corallococcus macrosporus DSM 14697]|uniref:Uncharacterized protein n=2 Tax=Corallococcus macrosporus TaxID=35 RepID=A0A250JLT6_9BACT|nr:hypothetical protein MYMAC_000426 [Corallococcus macrosporus DSM 14697]